MAIGGLDIGTSGAKCAAFSEDGKRIAFSKREYNTICEGGRFEIDARVVWNAAKAVLHDVGAQSREPISAIAVSALGEAGVPVSGAGEVLAPSILFNDPRGQNESEVLRERFGQKKLFRTTGVVANGCFTIEKLAWIMKHAPYCSKLKMFMPFEDFIIYMLTGARGLSYTSAARTLAFDVIKKCWRGDIIDALGLDMALLPPVYLPGTEIGTLRPRLAKELGLAADLKVVTGGHDMWCCTAGAGVFEPGTAVNVAGSCDSLNYLLDAPRMDDFMLRSNYYCSPYVLPDTYGTYAVCLTAGSVVKWFRDCFYKNWETVAGKTFYQTMDAAVSSSPSGLIVIPNFSIAGTPDFLLQARGLIEGMQLETTAYDIFRGIMEGVAYHIRMNLELLACGGITADVIRSVGGSSSSPVWSQIKADILGKPIDVVAGNEAGVIGCALIAGVGTGVYRTYDEGASRLVRIERRYEPHAKQRERYQAHFERYKQLYTQMWAT